MDIHTFLQNEMRKLHDTETQLLDGLSFLAGKARNEDLRTALLEHRSETVEHVRRIEQICASIQCPASGGVDTVTRALIAETQTLLQNAPMSSITDACIIAAAQKAEHLEIASYGTALALADEMDHDIAKDLLEKTLEEEKKADKRLSKIASHGINEEAVELSGQASMR